MPRLLIGRGSAVGRLVVLLLLSCTASFAQEELDLVQAINRALAHNRQLVRSAQSMDSSALQVTAARADFQLNLRPDVVTAFSDGAQSSRYGVRASRKFLTGTELSVATGLLNDRTLYTEDLRRGSLRIEIAQPIFRNFGTLVHREPITQATQALKAAEANLEMQKADLVVDVAQTYTDVLRLRRQVQSDRASFERMHALFRVTEAKEVLGRTTHIDTLRVELLRGRASSRWEASQERLASAEHELAELLGYPLETKFDLKPTPAMEIEVPETEDAVRIALENRLDYAQVQRDYADAVRGVAIARRRTLPDVKVIARHEWRGAGSGLVSAVDPRFDQSVWFLGLSVDPNFNLTKERASLGQAAVRRDAAWKTIEITEQSIARQAQQHLLAYKRAQKRGEDRREEFQTCRSALQTGPASFRARSRRQLLRH